MKHRLKTWPEAFDAIARGEKRHEVRRADRAFAVGDTLELCRFDPAEQVYTGERLTATISYLTSPGSFGLPNHLCVFSLAAVAPLPELRFAGPCSACGQITEARRQGLASCRWGRCNGAVRAMPQFA